MNLDKTEHGYIISKNEGRYFGFIVKSGEQEEEKIFWHGTALMDIGIHEVCVGDEVEFKTIITDKGTEAVAVKVIREGQR